MVHQDHCSARKDDGAQRADHVEAGVYRYNLFVDNNGDGFCKSLINAYNENKDLSTKVTASQIKYSLVRAFIETLVM